MIRTSPASFLRFALCAAVAALSATTASAQAGDPGSARSFGKSQPIAGQYIVVFKAGVGNPAAEAANIVRAAGGQIHHTYTSAIKGFAATLPAAALPGIQTNPNVDYIEQDQTVSLSQSAETPATWGIDRVDQASLPLDSTYHYNYDGFGVNAFIIDTGIRADHLEFTGRVRQGTTSIADGRGTNDCNGHGTHVSGTVGGTIYGIAKQVSLIPVRVLDCRGSGSFSGVIAGIDWVANSTLTPKVANMSLGGGLSSSVNQAVAGAVGKGVTMVVAAGNDGANACNYSPASEPSAITVGATTSTDARASYSNFGTCVDIFAPGSSITSAWNTSNGATNTISGTSMATPHVTGAAALAAQANPNATPATIASIITANATANRIASAGTGSPNLLLYSLGNTGTTVTLQTVGFNVPAIVTNASLVGKGGRHKGWQAQVTVTVIDIVSGANVANATVAGGFSAGAASVSCVTASNGSCTLSSGNLSLLTSMTTLELTGISGTNMTFDGQRASVSILKPQ